MLPDPLEALRGAGATGVTGSPAAPSVSGTVRVPREFAEQVEAVMPLLGLGNQSQAVIAALRILRRHAAADARPPQRPGDRRRCCRAGFEGSLASETATATGMINRESLAGRPPPARARVLVHHAR